jgi:ATP-dependent DNA helicase RecG
MNQTPLTSDVALADFISKKHAQALEKIELFTVEDLLLHWPIRYESERQAAGNAFIDGERIAIRGQVLYQQQKKTRTGRKILQVRLANTAGEMLLVFFKFYPSQLRLFQPGQKVHCSGVVRLGSGEPTLVHPQCVAWSSNEETAAVSSAAKILPVYPSTQGLRQAQWRQWQAKALQALHDGQLSFADYWPQATLSVLTALTTIHQPDPTADIAALVNRQHPACQRFIIEELAANQLFYQQLQQERQRHKGIPIHDQGWLAAFYRQLPFALTSSQLQSIAEIVADLGRPQPMWRLLQGDVGSGKTLVAAAAALLVAKNGWQVAVMAPTELLAEQHFKNFVQWFTPWGLTVLLLTGSSRGKKRRQQTIAEGSAQIVIGTQALFQAEVVFQKLGLVIIDEQQRFGVDQRLQLRQKGDANEHAVHQLFLTATPIPRTLAMVWYADLACSSLRERPPGRQAIKTVRLPQERRREIIERLKSVLTEGRQVYWVCSLITEQEDSERNAAESTWQELKTALPQVGIGLLHGKMRPTEKSAVMQDFMQQKLAILVATTVIEVGVDVPNASVMIIDNAECLGLSQLHQLRGRVGRGSSKSSCVLLYKAPLSAVAEARLNILCESDDGFVIAEKDLELRGAGEIHGQRQTGSLHFRISDLARDQVLLKELETWLQTLPRASSAALQKRWLPAAETRLQA